MSSVVNTPAKPAISPNSDEFEIAPGFKVSDWKKLDIQKNTALRPDWATAINVFERRISARFLNQIKAMMDNENSTAAGYCGFAVVALDCLLIETLAQFYRGNHMTPSSERSCRLCFWRKPDDPHVAAFHEVFQRSSTLKNTFDQKEKTKAFYQHIRCGLLHQAQTKRNSKINRKITTPIEWCDDKKPKKGLTVHPLLFHKCVNDIFTQYLKGLTAPESHDLRRKFRRKMNGIVGI